MRKILVFVFASVCLLGSSLYAGDPDLSEYSGAKAILDDMEKSAADGILPDFAVRNNPGIYSQKNIEQLIAIAGLDDLSLAQCQDYLSKATAITEVLRYTTMIATTNSSINSLEGSINRAKKMLRERPLKHLIQRLEQHGVYTTRVNDFIIYESVFLSEEENKMPVIEKALLFYKDKNLTVQDADVILGTPKNEYKDGLLYVSDEMIRKFPERPADLVNLNYLVRLKTIFDDKIMDKALEVIFTSTDSNGIALGKMLTNKCASRELGLLGESFVKKITTKEGYSKGFENLDNVMKFIEKK
jgi:hypothetical protein